MSSLILELIGDAIVTTCLATGGAFLLKRRDRKKRDPFRPLPDGTLPWSIYVYNDGTDYGFRCPKCVCYRKNHAQPPICSCEEFYQDHFHFKCKDCGYKAIIRTADEEWNT